MCAKWVPIMRVLAKAVDSRSDAPAKGRITERNGHYARHIKKIIVKLCAGKPDAQFERGLMETGRR
jgi:hypothetical protein